MDANPRKAAKLSGRLRTRTPEPTRQRRVVDIMSGHVVDVFEQDHDTPIIDRLKKAPASLNTFRDDGYLHVSDMIGKCVRAIALSELHNKPMPSRRLTHSQGLTFAQGTAIHDYVKERFVESHRKNVYGMWSCLCKNTIVGPCTGDGIENGPACSSCGTTPYRYEELEVTSDEYGLTGSPDLLVLVKAGAAVHITEIKSISHDEWKIINRAKPDHIVQVLTYWKLMKDKGYSLTSNVSVLYVTKGFVFKGGPYKEFLVSAEDQERYTQDYLREAKSLVLFKDGEGELPARTLCPTMSSPKVKECHVAMECFRDG